MLFLVLPELAKTIKQLQEDIHVHKGCQPVALERAAGKVWINTS